MNEKPVKKGFLAKILENNREFDSTLSVFFVFFITIGTVTAIITAVMIGKQVPEELFEIVNVFENFILMILSYFFTRATTGGGGQPK